jgi:hypothetical protein
MVTGVQTCALSDLAIEELDCEVADTPPTPPNVTTPPKGTIPPEGTLPPTGTTIPDETPDKVPVPLTGPNIDPGAGGSPEEGNDPQNDSDKNGYGPGDSKASLPATSEVPVVTADTTPATTGTLAPAPSVVANGSNQTAPQNTDPAQGGINGDPGAPQD